MLIDELFKERDFEKSKLCKDNVFDTLRLLLNPRNMTQALKFMRIS